MLSKYAGQRATHVQPLLQPLGDPAPDIHFAHHMVAHGGDMWHDFLGEAYSMCCARGQHAGLELVSRFVGLVSQLGSLFGGHGW